MRWLVPCEIRTALLRAAGAVGMVLLIACANVGQSASGPRGSPPQRDCNPRSDRRRATRIAQQLLTESLLVSLLGGALGVVFGYGIVVSLAARFSRLFQCRRNID